MSDVLRFPSNGLRRGEVAETGRDGVRVIEDPDGEGHDVRSEPRLRSVIGDVLREERRAQDRTLADVAERAAVSLPYLSEVERGRKEVSSDLLRAICDALELPLVDVLDRSAERLRIDAGAHRGASVRLMAA